MSTDSMRPGHGDPRHAKRIVGDLCVCVCVCVCVIRGFGCVLCCCPLGPRSSGLWLHP